MNINNKYSDILASIKESLKYKMGYPSSLMSMLYGEYKKDGIEVSFDAADANKLVNNQKIGLIEGGFGEVLVNNVGDPFYNSNSTDSHETKLLEKEVIEILGRYFGLNKDEARGYVTSGGTESNMTAIWWAKLKLSKISSSNPILICTKDEVHYSVQKICNIMNIPLHLVESMNSDGMNVAKLEEFLVSNVVGNPNGQSVILVTTVGSTISGSSDNVLSISRLLSKFKSKYQNLNYVIHIDGALCGITLPIIKPFGNINNYFDELNVSTISISGHKFLGTTVCGVVLTKETFLKEAFASDKNAISYCGDIVDTTISGSRPGLSALLLHNTLCSLELHIHTEKIEKIIRNNLANAKYFYAKLVKIVGGKNVRWIPNQFNVIFPRPSLVMMKKYQLMPAPNNMCVACILLNVNIKLIDTFITEYKEDFNASNKG